MQVLKIAILSPFSDYLYVIYSFNQSILAPNGQYSVEEGSIFVPCFTSPLVQNNCSHKGYSRVEEEWQLILPQH